jgi:hypothetical protein
MLVGLMSNSAAQVSTSPTTQPASTIPLTIRFSGILKSIDASSGTSSPGVTFAIYAEQESDAPLWTETQTVKPDANGRFTATLGSTPDGLPVTIFANGTARWIGFISSGYLGSARTRILSVPYAMKAVDAETLGGTPASDFVRAEELSAIWANMFHLQSEGQTRSQIPTQVVSSNLLPAFNADVWHGLPVSAFAQLAVRNIFTKKQVFEGGVILPPTGIAKATDANGFSSNALRLDASAFNTATSKAEKERFIWQAEATNSNTDSPSGRMSLLFGKGPNPFVETGFSINADGSANLVASQTIPLTAISGALADAGLMDPIAGGPPQTPIVNTGPYQWQQNPQGNSSKANKGIQVGTNTVTLTPCPKGVNGTDVQHYLYLSGSGTPEAVLITGGSCTSGANTGSIEFSATYPHPAGYKIGTATAGVQEALIVAAIPGSGGDSSRNVQLNPGTLTFHAPLAVRSSGFSITGSGTTVVCAVQDTCIMLGDRSAGVAQDIVLQNISVAPGEHRGTWPAIEDNAQHSTIQNITGAGTIQGNTFGALVQIDNDQAAKIDGLETNPGSWNQCDIVFCSVAILGAGPAGSGRNSGVIWVSNSNLGMKCAGNGIDNQDGNTLHVENTIVEAFSQFGIRSQGTYGVNPSVQLTNVYEEIGNCQNPLGTGIAGLIVEGGYAEVSGGTGPGGKLPEYSATGNTPYDYYVVVHSSDFGVSPAFLAGYAMSDGTTPVHFVWNQVGNTGVVTYDILRITGDPEAGSTVAPYGTGAFAIATGVSTSNCTNKVCSFIDNPISVPSTYTVFTNGPYSPALTLWPGGVILTTRWDYENTGGAVPTRYYQNSLHGQTFVNSEGAMQPSVFAQQCDGLGEISSIWISCANGNGYSNDNPAIGATVIQMGSNGGQPGGLKGRTIYQLPPNSTTSGTEIITLVDSNPEKTNATSGNRPPWEPRDTYIAFDQASNANLPDFQLAFGAPISVSRYVNSVPDGKNWLERLTAADETYKVPVVAPVFETPTCISLSGDCGSYSGGIIAIPPGTNSTTIWTTSITQMSKIHIDENFSYGSVLGLVCDTNLGRRYAIAAQVQGTGFSVITDVPPLAGFACLSFSFEN